MAQTDDDLGLGAGGGGTQEEGPASITSETRPSAPPDEERDEIDIDIDDDMAPEGALPGSTEPVANGAAATVGKTPKLPPLRNYSVHPSANGGPTWNRPAAAAAAPPTVTIIPPPSFPDRSSSPAPPTMTAAPTANAQYQQSASRPAAAAAAVTSPTSASQQQQISDLLQMLECPICMDTADRPPIYQCPEGHLLCEDCNSRVVDCPQCGHALMNSRNRTAEELAAKLQTLRGDRRDELAPTQTVSVTVSAPKKVRRGLFSSVVYQISTKVEHESGVGADGDRVGSSGANKFSVSRAYSDVLDLHKRLVFDHRKEGVIVPPPPAKNRLATAMVLVSGKTDLNESVASHMFERRCVALDRYMKRLARHPVIRKDPVFRAFVQEKDLPKDMKRSSTIKEAIKGRMAVFRSKFTVKEEDPWFQTRLAQLESFAKQLKEMRSNLREMSMQKYRLHVTTTHFQRGLVSMLVGRPSRDNHLGSTIGDVVDCHKTMAAIHQRQSEADELIVQLAEDYALLIDSAKETLTERRRCQQDMARAQKAKKAPIEEVEAAQETFDKLSQAIRRELEHFDFVMRGEFEEGFQAYKASYWNSLKMRNKTLVD